MGSILEYLLLLAVPSSNLPLNEWEKEYSPANGTFQPQIYFWLEPAHNMEVHCRSFAGHAAPPFYVLFSSREMWSSGASFRDICHCWVPLVMIFPLQLAKWLLDIAQNDGTPQAKGTHIIWAAKSQIVGKCHSMYICGPKNVPWGGLFFVPSPFHETYEWVALLFDHSFLFCLGRQDHYGSCLDNLVNFSQIW